MTPPPPRVTGRPPTAARLTTCRLRASQAASAFAVAKSPVAEKDEDEPSVICYEEVRDVACQSQVTYLRKRVKPVFQPMPYYEGAYPDPARMKEVFLGLVAPRVLSRGGAPT